MYWLLFWLISSKQKQNKNAAQWESVCVCEHVCIYVCSASVRMCCQYVC